MKKLVVSFILLIASACFAADENPSGFSMLLGLDSIGSELGYNVGMATPYFNETALQLTFGQHIFSAQKNGNYINNTYNTFGLHSISRIYRVEKFVAFFKSGALIAPPSDVANITNVILNFGLGTEYFYSNRISAFGELGWAFPITAKANLFF